MIRRTLCLAALPVAVTGLIACSSTSSSDAITVTSTNSACRPEKTSFDAGKLTFKVTNKGSKPTELYVYGEGDRVISEVENVGPGTSRTLTVDLKAGSYELACKPGQVGKGIRAPITVTGSGGSQSSSGPESADRELHVTTVDYRFEFPDGAPAGFEAGQTVKFELANDGKEPHEFEVFGPDGKVVGEVGETAPGEEGEAVLTLSKPGTYRYVCGVDDHEKRGMEGTFEVA